ncbi:hypothetical protein BDP55DRAFT_656507, partial [Colletotrichum godetiae]
MMSRSSLVADLITGVASLSISRQGRLQVMSVTSHIHVSINDMYTIKFNYRILSSLKSIKEFICHSATGRATSPVYML